MNFRPARWKAQPPVEAAAAARSQVEPPPLPMHLWTYRKYSEAAANSKDLPPKP